MSMEIAHPAAGEFGKGGEMRARSAVVIVPAQHLLDGAGAAAVFRQEIAVFKKLGWRVGLLVVAPSLKVRASSRRRWLDAVAEAGRQVGADECSVLAEIKPLSAWAAVMRLLSARALGRWDVETDIAVSELVDARTIEALEPNSIVVCNYLSGAAAADALAPRARQILVLHDMPERSLTARVGRSLAGWPHIVSLTPADGRRVEALTGVSCEVGIPFERGLNLHFGDVLRYRSLEEIFSASGPANTARSGEVTGESLDLLFVGGKHPPNIEGLSAFVDKCFVPYLGPSGVRLVVAGEVGPSLWGARPPPDGIVVLGRVSDLRPLYAAAKLVIAPLMSGTGISLKTLEAVSLGKPVLSSPVGLRGIDAPLSSAAEPPFDQRWAGRIASLLESRKARRRLRDEIYAGVSASTLDSTLETIAGRLSAGVVSRNERFSTLPEASPLVEWVPGVQEIIDRATSSSDPDQVVQIRIADALAQREYGSRDDCLDLACDLCKAAEDNRP